MDQRLTGFALSVGVIASHGDFPIERIKLDRNRRWLGSVSHDETLKLTDVADLFEDSDDEGEGSADDDVSDMEGIEGGGKDLDDPDTDEEEDQDDDMGTEGEGQDDGENKSGGGSDSDDDAEDAAQARRDRKRQKREERKEAKKLGLNGKPLFRPKEEAEEEDAKASFFDDL